MPFIKPFVRYFQFSGRAGRAEFWQYIALVTIVSMVIGLLEAGSLMAAAENGMVSTPVWSSVFGLLTFIPSVAVTFRRLHDRNKSGWLYGYLLCAFVPLIFVIALSASFPAIWPLAVAGMLGIGGYAIYLIYELAQPGDWYGNDYGEPDNEVIGLPRSVSPLTHAQNSPLQSIPQPHAASQSTQPPSPPNADVFAQIERLAGLHSQGALTDEEFAAQKARLLNSL